MFTGGGGAGGDPLPIKEILRKILLTPLPKTKIVLSKNDLTPLPKAEDLKFTPLPKGPTSAHVCLYTCMVLGDRCEH